MTGIRTTTVGTSILGVAVLGIGLTLGACANPAAKTAAPVAAPTTPAAPILSAPPGSVAAPAPVAAPAVQVAPVAAVAPVSVPPTPPSAPPSDTATPVPSAPPAASASPSVTTPRSVSNPPSASTPPSGLAPHFTTPDAAMRYLAAAYNRHDLAAEMHVTTPDSRTMFEAERQWVTKFRFRSCTANGAPYWDYNCILDIAGTAPDISPTIDATTGQVVMNEVALLVAPAARTGYYLNAVEGCGG